MRPETSRPKHDIGVVFMAVRRFQGAWPGTRGWSMVARPTEGLDHLFRARCMAPGLATSRPPGVFHVCLSWLQLFSCVPTWSTVVLRQSVSPPPTAQLSPSMDPLNDDDFRCLHLAISPYPPSPKGAKMDPLLTYTTRAIPHTPQATCRFSHHRPSPRLPSTISVSDTRAVQGGCDSPPPRPCTIPL